ncbi:hypothetical protein [Mariniflexile maritimum]|uniref:hypothetical protein n=1 Tax=Mariniflexile maritimum TaxID=2682493 RepID=UPI0012F64316|nr:hypothetical protein [Mariniflexile maritimum]
MRKLLIVNILTILGVSISSYFIYVWILQYTKTDVLKSQIILAYVINTILAIAIMCALFAFRKKFKDLLGFVFMMGSFVKFAFFFVVFYPTYHSDGIITRQEFLSFFVPYVICLIAETLTSIRLLNRLDAK